MTKDSWYEIVDGGEPLLQGDSVSSCPVAAPLEQGDRLSVEILEYDVIVMSQSCDLANKKLALVLVCPVWTLAELGKTSGFFAGTKGKQALRRGYVTGYHLLNESKIEGFEREYSVVDFRSAYSVPFGFLTDIAKRRGRRLRLLSPYREHLSQAFARFFMRVGLPTDIPPFE